MTGITKVTIDDTITVTMRQFMTSHEHSLVQCCHLEVKEVPHYLNCNQVTVVTSSIDFYDVTIHSQQGSILRGVCESVTA